MTVELYDIYPLISESLSNSNYAGNAYTEIFGAGNSFESIFELNFVNNQSVANNTVSSFYGSSSNKTGQIGAPTFLYSDAYAVLNDYFTKTDCRYLENMSESNNKIYISKYVNQSVSFRTSTTTGAAPTVNGEVRSSAYANWIIYRLTDVMLMRAEAEIALAGNVEEGMTLTEEQLQHYHNAFSCISAVWKRANNKRTSSTGLLEFDEYATSRLAMEELLFAERQRELMFEGKRWFDLVRISRRDGENTRLINKVLPKFQENTSAIRIKLSTQDVLYWPYNRDELKQNPLLIQNPAYVTDNTEQNF